MGVVVLPYSLTAKTPAKASEVMADLNAIVGQVNGKLDLENFAESLRNALIPTATILPTGRGSAPAGFLLCQGQAVSRTTYSVLFAAIGTNFGAGDGTTTFNLPDLRGRVAVGVDGGAGRLTIAANTLGKVGGDQNMQLHSHANGGGTSVENAQHNHSISGFANTRHEGSGFAYTNWDGPNVGNVTGVENQLHAHVLTGATQGAGSGGAQNLQPYQVVNYMIKT